ncbi:hypothetical protein EDD53_1260 [Pacificibacter maritimus]|uniref:Uncharacterized protein n=1 Tax=Pacificibacter maritimus TaxID=762213 RepID=A0A3N4V4S6_9RHOB|nr:hypothetical protein [Pacificibacter maritimus]RPE72117.1 hypothetical protein EDD53_1260 [Pacificibacter maritimus]
MTILCRTYFKQDIASLQEIPVSGKKIGGVLLKTDVAVYLLLDVA